MVVKRREKLINISYQPSSLWEFEVLQGKGFSPPENIKYQVKSITIPYASLETKTANTGTKYITNYESEGDYTIEFYEDTDMSIHDFLLKWKTTLFNHATRIFNPTIKLNFVVRLFHYENGQRVLSKRFEFNKTYIKSITQYTLNYENSDILITSGNFVSDGVIIYAADSGSPLD